MKDRTERIVVAGKQGASRPQNPTSQDVVISQLSPSEEATYQALIPHQEHIEEEAEDEQTIEKLEEVIRERIAKRIMARSPHPKDLGSIEQEEREYVFGEALKAVAKVDPASVSDYEKILAPIRATTKDTQTGQPVAINVAPEEKQEKPTTPSQGGGSIPPVPPLPPEKDGEDLPPEDKKNSFIGKKIQWKAQGVKQFRKGVTVTHLSPDGQYVFIEGSHRGIPITEIEEFPDTELPAQETSESFEPRRYTLQKIAEGTVPITGTKKIVAFFDDPEIGRQLRYLDADGKQGKTDAVISVRINLKGEGTLVETKHSTYLVTDAIEDSNSQISFPETIDPKDIFDPKVFLTQNIPEPTPEISFPKNIDTQQIVDPKVFSVQEKKEPLIEKKEVIQKESPIKTTEVLEEKPKTEEDAHGWEEYTNALRAFEEKYGDKKDYKEIVARVGSTPIQKQTLETPPQKEFRPLSARPEKSFKQAFMGMFSKKEKPVREHVTTPVIQPAVEQHAPTPETQTLKEGPERSAEELGNRLKEIEAAIEQEAEKKGFGNHIKNISAWYKHQPAWQKYTVGAAIITLGLGAGVVGGTAGIGMLGAAGSMGVARRALTGIGTSILVNELLVQSYEKRGIKRGEGRAWFHRVLAIGSGVLIGGGVVGEALGNIGAKSGLLDKTLGNPKTPETSLSKAPLPLLEKDPDVLAHRGELDTLSTHMGEGVEPTQTHIHTVTAGDSVWKLLEKEIPEGRLGARHYMIDAIKDKLANMSPEEIKNMGIQSGDINKIAIGETIDFSKIFSNKEFMDHIGVHAGALTEEQLKNIENYKQSPSLETPAGESTHSPSIPVEEFPEGNNQPSHGESGQQANNPSSVPVEEWPDEKTEAPSPREEVVASQGARDPNLAPEKVRTWSPEVMNKYLDTSYNQKYQELSSRLGEREANRLVHEAGVKAVNVVLDTLAKTVQPETFSFFPHTDAGENIRAVKTAWGTIAFQQATAYKDYFFGQASETNKTVSALYRGLGGLAREVGEHPRPGETIEDFVKRIALKLEIKKGLLTS